MNSRGRQPQSTASLRAGRLAIAALVVTACLVATAIAQPAISESELEELLKVKVRTVQHMALNPVMVRAVRVQNAENLTPEEIKRRDEEWRASKELTPFKLSLQTSPAGRFLAGQVQRSASFNEAFLTDNKGANVAAYPATSDYWLGDEEKWIASYNGGDGKIFIGPLERDESTQTVAAQISAPVIDRGETIGVLIVGVTISYLEERRR